MKTARSASPLAALVPFVLSAAGVFAQNNPEVRRAQPVDQGPVPRAAPALPAPSAPVAKPPVPRADQEGTSSGPSETESPDRRQLEYATALYSRKLYDLAIPEFEKYLDEY